MKNRFFSSSSAYGLVLNGDKALCAQWIGYAQGQLQGILARHDGPTTVLLKPKPEVEVRIDTRPNKISITVAGGLPVTVADKASSLVSGMSTATSPYQAREKRFIISTPTKIEDRLLCYGGQRYWIASDGRLAINWINAAVYVGGYYTVLTANTTIDYVAVSTSAALKALYPTYARFLVVVEGFTFRIYGCSDPANPTISYFSSTLVYTDSTGIMSPIGMAGAVTVGFMGNAKEFIFFGQDLTAHTQILKKLTFSDDYTTATETTLWSAPLTHVNTTWTDGLHFTVSMVASNDNIIKAFILRDVINLVMDTGPNASGGGSGSDILAYSSSKTSTGVIKTGSLNVLGGIDYFGSPMPYSIAFTFTNSGGTITNSNVYDTVGVYAADKPTGMIAYVRSVLSGTKIGAYDDTLNIDYPTITGSIHEQIFVSSSTATLDVTISSMAGADSNTVGAPFIDPPSGGYPHVTDVYGATADAVIPTAASQCAYGGSALILTYLFNSADFSITDKRGTILYAKGSPTLLIPGNNYAEDGGTVLPVSVMMNKYPWPLPP